MGKSADIRTSYYNLDLSVRLFNISSVICGPIATIRWQSVCKNESQGGNAVGKALVVQIWKIAWKNGLPKICSYRHKSINHLEINLDAKNEWFLKQLVFRLRLTRIISCFSTIASEFPMSI